MAKNWYPVIDYFECIECGACVKICPNGVYNKDKSPTPVVSFTDGCSEGNHGCGNLCPKGAITYVGDNTGWVPPNGKITEQEQCCTGGSKPKEQNTIIIDFLFLDLNTCDRCVETENNLISAISELEPVLKSAGYELIMNKILIDSKASAEKYKFESSPTIRVNGIDVLGEVKENYCSECSAISGEETSCRVFTFNGTDFSEPPKGMIINGILSGLYGSSRCIDDKPYTIPENISTFFKGKDKSDCGCSCGANCC